MRASVIFTDIVDNYPQHRAYPDALFLLGESLFAASDYLGARTRYRQIIEHADQPAFRPYVQRALGRLIEIAIHTRDFDGVEELLRAPEPAAAAGGRGRDHLLPRQVPLQLRGPRRGRDARRRRRSRPRSVDQRAARAGAPGVRGGRERSPYYPQARYFIGVIYTLRGQYPQAIEAFRRVAALAGEHARSSAQVVELAQLALGRLYYETDQLDQASRPTRACRAPPPCSTSRSTRSPGSTSAWATPRAPSARSRC